MRRRFKSKTGFPLTKTTGDIARNRGFQMPIEMRKAKRVRFDDAESDAHSTGHEAIQSPISGAPKTSEYAYFRKVKDGHCHAVHKENEQFNSSEHSYLLGESNKESERLDPGINFCISGESAVPSGHKLFTSPPVSRYGESNETRRKELTHKTKERLPLLTEIVTPVRQNPFSSPLNPATDKSENQCIEKGLFSEKRKRLCQWVADTTCSEVKKLQEKGFDLVSFLLGRLIPKGNENNDSSKENADNSSKPLTVYELDNVGNGLSLCHKRDLHKKLPKFSTSERSSEIVVRGWDSYNSGFPSNYHKEGDLQKATDHSERSSEIVVWGWDSYDSGFPSNYHKEGDLPKTMDYSERSSEIVLKEWDSFHSGFPSDYNQDIHLQDETKVPDQHINSPICNSSDIQHGLSFCLPFESFKSLGAFHFRDLDEYGPVIGHCREESYRNSLEWDFGAGKDRADHCLRQNVCQKPANAWNSNKQRIEDNIMLDTEGFYPSSLFSRPSLFRPLPEYVPTGCLRLGVRPEFDDVKYAMVEPRHVSMSFPCSPNCISLAEDKNAEDFLYNGNIILPYRDPRWQKCMSHGDFWWNCLPAPEFFAEDHASRCHAWKFPENDNGSCSLSLLKEAPKESFTPYYDEGTFNNYLLSSTLHPPLDTFMKLLNHAGDYDSELGCRKML